MSSKPRKEYAPKPRMTLELLPPSESHNGGIHSAKSPGRSPGREVYSGLLNECQTPFCQDYNNVLTQQTWATRNRNKRHPQQLSQSLSLMRSQPEVDLTDDVFKRAWREKTNRRDVLWFLLYFLRNISCCRLLNVIVTCPSSSNSFFISLINHIMIIGFSKQISDAQLP